MADKGWTARVATAAGAAAGTGAAQLGLGYGLGVVVWPVTATPDDSAWLGSLGWATWITASATVFGAVLGSRYKDGPGPRTSGPWRFALAACAAVGALVTVALIALPARSAVRFDTLSPQVVAGGYAVVGLVLGLVVAFWAVSSRPVAANLMATGVWLWALAIAAIAVELTVNRDSATYLTSWQFAEVANSGLYGTIYWPSALLTLGAAFLVGAVTVAPAALRGDLGVGAATSGLAGPLLVAIAFLALAPRLTGALGPIESAYLISPYAVLAGLAGSVLTVTLTRTVQDQRSRRAGSVVSGTARVAEPSGSTTPVTQAGPSSAAPSVPLGAASSGVASSAGTPSAGTSSAGTSSTGTSSTGSSSAGSSSAARPESRKPEPRKPESRKQSEPREQQEQPKQPPAKQPKPPRSGLFGRRKVPAQPTPVADDKTGDNRSASAKSSPASTSEGRSTSGSTGSAAGRGTSSGSNAAASSSAGTSSTGSANTSPTSSAGTSASGSGGNSATSSGGNSASGSGGNPASRSSTRGATPSDQDKSPKPANGSPAPIDSEIAAAARPPRPRPRKTTPAKAAPETARPKSTVTPPPSTPTIAEINPKPKG
ncbi:Hansenula MRAKII killer toxin-resistant protein 1 [Actinoplanes sp. LDG1-06]|uniref:Hansenula MRAKII killer toxin-resistant protein 1 n=1 Tax=Paractinoplanes ovalisporus TaxID=2810368 RepID=A0ABS2AAH6_9ACTN|nr:Hansenula MRAKII killer toxin-resistant protein 1 [Actinoplanes ovalisporus]MBM2616831.1 Hansenula MRAKII killer toxin-resistant protein 1 [Actinoplanes ovalisporus]